MSGGTSTRSEVPVWADNELMVSGLGGAKEVPGMVAPDMMDTLWATVLNGHRTTWGEVDPVAAIRTVVRVVTTVVFVMVVVKVMAGPQMTMDVVYR